MASNRESHTFGILLAGLGVGTLFGMLLAPRTGREMRRYLRERLEEGSEGFKRQAQNMRERAGEVLEKGKEYADRGRESLGAAVETGRQAYREEKDRIS
jgi:gas vesicle protein